MTPASFANEVRAVQDDLRRYLLALCCGNGPEADDIAQEALVKAYLALDSRRDVASTRKWIFSIAHHCFIDAVRRRKADSPIEHAADMPADAASAPDSAFRYQRLHAALATLPPRERSVILLFYFRGYSSKEIAAMTSSTDEAVRQQLSRARRQLKQILNLDI